MQKRHSLFKIILTISCLSTWAAQELPVAGTPSRLEQEFKFAFKVKDDVSIRSILIAMENHLHKLLKSDKLGFNKYLNTDYRLTKEAKTFIFKDFYLDDENLNLYKANSDYRLRYRWSSYTSFLGSSLFPYLNFFYPNRCEVQFKHGYQRIDHPNFVSVYETRFEFRSESSPFDKNSDAPSPPWPFAEFINYAKTGKYDEQYQMLPYAIAKKVVKNFSSLTRVTPITTVRYRSHLHINSPWGSGPNPTQAFIISLDLVQYKKKNGKKFKFLELELEMERNISTLLDTLANPPKFAYQKFFKDDELKEAKIESIKAKKILRKDQEILAIELSKILRKKFRLTPLATKNKYHRVIGHIIK